MKRIFLLLLCCALVLGGCSGADAPPQTRAETTAAAEAEIRFPDGEPGTVTCLGSYTAEAVSDTVVALVGEEELTNRELQAWYWAEVAQFRLSGEAGPDFDRPLDEQGCHREGVTTWQQYFLQAALDSWHTAQALVLQGEDEGVPTEEKYNPINGNYEKYMDGMPATEYLYGYYDDYRPNSMHQAYLDALPEQVQTLAQALGYSSGRELASRAMGTDEQSLLSFARTYNLAYMYFTTLSYQLEVAEETGVLGSEKEAMVDFRHILCPTYEEAKALLDEWDDDWRPTESTFAQMAHDHSQDPGSASEGGLYRHVTQEQIPQALAQWCFAETREPGDTTVLVSEHGAHAVYFVQRSSRTAVLEAQQLRRDLQRDLLRTAREKYPMAVAYDAIALTEAEGTLDKDALLYADLAHERFPEVPLYLQQDYPGVRYGGYELRSNGCGITSFAMLASYLTDEELTPPEMCALFGRYSLDSGTDSSLFARESAGLGCYLLTSTYEWRDAREYIEAGYTGIVLQHAGYWTRGGHYLVLEEMDEDGMVRVRDSNIYNYFRIREGHLVDRFSWDTIYPRSSGYWIFDYKDVTHPACTRCGSEEGKTLCSGYLCTKCEEATLRRSVYLTGI